MKYEFFDPQLVDPCKLIFHHNDFHLVPAHFHAAVEVNYVFSGHEDWVTVAGAAVRPGGGDVLVINGNVPHAFTPAADRAPYDAVTLIFPADELVTLYPALRDQRWMLNTAAQPAQRQTPAYQELSRTFVRMLTCYQGTSDRDLARIQLRGLAYQVLAQLLWPAFLQPRTATAVDSGAANRPLLISAVTYLHAHLAEPLTNAAIATALHVSVSKLTHLFRAEMGCSVQSYLRSQRLARAYELLAGPEKSVTAIADLAGFPNAKAFTAAFKAVYHTTPRHYRLTRQFR